MGGGGGGAIEDKIEYSVVSNPGCYYYIFFFYIRATS